MIQRQKKDTDYTDGTDTQYINLYFNEAKKHHFNQFNQRRKNKDADYADDTDSQYLVYISAKLKNISPISRISVKEKRYRLRR